jgi:dihydrofolate reductase
MKLIIACDPKGGIGYNNKLPWSKIEGDLPRFKSLTMKKVVIMGRNTWDSLPKKPLPNRTNYVFTSRSEDINVKDAYAINSLSILKHFNENACIIGGAKVIKSCWDRITEVHLTRVVTEYTCDTFIDLVKLEKEFMCWFKEQHVDHSYEIWKRK